MRKIVSSQRDRMGEDRRDRNGPIGQAMARECPAAGRNQIAERQSEVADHQGEEGGTARLSLRAGLQRPEVETEDPREDVRAGRLERAVLLLAVCAVVITGLFSAGDEGLGGPLAGRFGSELSELHEPAFRILQALVVLHLAGAAVTSLASRENLIGAMVSGLNGEAPRRRFRRRASS